MRRINREPLPAGNRLDIKQMDLAALNAEADRLFAAHENHQVLDFDNYPFPKSKHEKEAEKETKLSSMRDLLRHAKANDHKFGQLFRSSSKVDVTRPENALPREYLRRKSSQDEEEDPEVPEPCAYCRGGGFCAIGCVHPKESKLPGSFEVYRPPEKGRKVVASRAFMSFKQFKERRIE